VTTMTSAELVEKLRAVARTYIEAGKDTLRRGEEVLPVLVVLNASGGAAVAGIAGPTTADERAAIVAQLVKAFDGAALLFFSDTFRRDPATLAVVGEALTAVIQTRNDDGAAVSCVYTRDPLAFGPVEDEAGRASFMRDVFPRPAKEVQ
jgi:hypothetical protein